MVLRYPVFQEKLICINQSKTMLALFDFKSLRRKEKSLDNDRRTFLFGMQPFGEVNFSFVAQKHGSHIGLLCNSSARLLQEHCIEDGDHRHLFL